VNFDRDLGNFFHQENFEESEKDDNLMEQGQDTKGAAKHPRKSQVVFCGCAKVCVAERCHDRRLWSSCLPILSASAERHLSNDRIARNIWHEWFDSLGTVQNKLFDIPFS